MSVSTSDFTLNPVQTGAVLSEIQKVSAFQAASKLVQLSGSGVILSAITPTDASWVGEGAKKPVVDNPVTEVTVIAKKLAKAVVWTDEAGSDIPNLEAKLMEDGIPALARAFDKTAAGEKAAPAGFAHLDASVSTVNISDLSTFTDAETPVGTAGETQFVMNKALFFALKKLTNPLGGRLLDIVKETEITGTIEGVRYYIYASDETEPVGYAGPFATEAYWGVIPGSVSVRPITGAYEDESGNVIAMDQYNMRGFIVEGRFGYAVKEVDNFKVLSANPVAPEAPVEEEEN